MWPSIDASIHLRAAGVYGDVGHWSPPYFGRLVNPCKKIVFKNEFGSFQIKIVMIGKKEIPRYNCAKPPKSSVLNQNNKN